MAARGIPWWPWLAGGLLAWLLVARPSPAPPPASAPPPRHFPTPPSAPPPAPPEATVEAEAPVAPRREMAEDAAPFTPPPAPPSEEDALPRPPRPSPAVREPEEPVLTVGALLAQAATAADEDEKLRLLARADELAPQERARALATWFLQEKNAPVAAEIVRALGDHEGEGPARLQVLAWAIRADRPAAVRQAAAEVLEGLDGPAARRLWRQLSADPAYREQAAAALERIDDDAK